jgi:hypothetical protein
VKRRTFLRRTATAAGGVIAFDHGLRRVRTAETIRIGVYQTDRLTNRFVETGQSAEVGQQLAAEAVAEILEPQFSSAFEVEYDSLAVPHEVASLPPTVSTFGENLDDATRSLTSWMEYNGRRSSVDSHLLLAYHPALRLGNGIATPGVLPACCGPIDRYGIAWMATEQFDRFREGVRQTIAHEIGHTIGLQHVHGTNVGDSISVMLTSSYARRTGRNLFGERVRPGLSRVSSLNEAISERHLCV